jgi:hypothetical protein
MFFDLYKNTRLWLNKNGKSIFIASHFNCLNTIYKFGCGVFLKYGFTAVNPFGNLVTASSLDTAGVMITSSPLTQSAGVAT